MIRIHQCPRVKTKIWHRSRGYGGVKMAKNLTKAADLIRFQGWNPADPSWSWRIKTNNNSCFQLKEMKEIYISPIPVWHLPNRLPSFCLIVSLKGVCLCLGLSNNAARHLSFKVCPLLTEWLMMRSRATISPQARREFDLVRSLEARWLMVQRITNFLSGSDKGVRLIETFFKFIFPLFLVFDHVLTHQNPVWPRLCTSSRQTRRADIKQAEKAVSQKLDAFLSALCLLEKTLNTCLSVTHPFPRALVPKCLSWD